MKKHIILLILITLIGINYSLAQVTANFTTPNASGCPNPFLAILNDASTSSSGTIISWNWQITGPAGFTTLNSTNNQVTAPLNIPGLYNVTLTACDNLGNCNTRTINGFIEVFSRPTISYSISPTSGCPPLPVFFDGTISPGCGSIQSSVFDLRDGNIISNQTDFTHTYTNSGNYSNFVVSVTNSCGCVTTSTINQTVSVTAAPIANFSSSQTFTCGASLTTTINSTSSAPAGSVVTWFIPGLANGVSGNSITRTFTSGSYDVTMIITAPSGCSDTLVRNNYIAVGNQTANFTSDITNVCIGNSVSFQNTSTGSPSSFQWSFPGGSPATSTQANPTVTYSTLGSYNVSLIVNYSGGCADTISMPNYINVSNSPVNNYIVTNSTSCALPFTTSFTSTSTNSVQTSWQFPGGSPASFVGSGPVNVTYNSFGSFNVIMRDSSSTGCVRTSTFNNVITLNALTATITGVPLSGCIPLTSNLGFTLNQPFSVASANWTLPGSDLGTSNLNNPSPIYNSTGCFDVTLQVSTTNGCIANAIREDYICTGETTTGSFTYTPSSICFESEEVCFTHIGLGSDTVLWNFGDGSASQFSSPNSTICYPYSNDLGQFTVTMIPFQSGCAGDTVIVIDAVEVLGPIANFTSNFSCTNQRIRNFVNTSTDADSVYWTFGDPLAGGADNSSLSTPTYLYSDTGTYTVTLTAFNFTTGCSHSTTNSIIVLDPTADFTSNLTDICVGSTVTFTNTSLFPNINTALTRWDWDLNDGLTFPNNVETRGRVRARTFSTIGEFSISMRNQDNNGCLDTITKLNYIKVHGILGGFTTTSAQIGCAPFLVSFEDTSVAPLTGIASWSWNFGDPSSNADTSNISNPTYTYTNSGFYSVTLTVTDSFGCIRTYNYPNYIQVFEPSANFSIDRSFICNNQSIEITSNSIGNSLSYNWQFSNATPISSTLPNPGTVTFNQEGVQTIFLEVTDSLGCTSDTTLSVSVFDVEANGGVSNDNILCFNPPEIINFNNLSVNNIDSSSVIWDFGNGITSTNFNASYFYPVSGTYPVSLTISSLTGCTSTTFIDTIIIGGPYAEINLISVNDFGCPCAEIEFEIKTVNSTSPLFIAGDGNSVVLSTSPIAGDTVIDTLIYSYCEIGTFFPSVFVQDGSCSGNITLQDPILIDSINIDFNFSVAGICDTGQVCFNDLSNSELLGDTDIISWQWDFGDGNTSTDQNPCNFYTSSGNFLVNLVVENTKGCIKSLSKNVHIPELPVAQFSQSDTSGCLSILVDFTDLSTFDDSTSLQSWLWDFGNGNTSTNQNPSFTFSTLGINNISLTVTDTFGCVNTIFSQVEVFDLPTVQVSNDTSICIGTPAQIISNGGVSYTWSPDYFISDINISNPEVSPLTDTTYIVLVTDINGCENSDSVSISVNSLTPNFNTANACEGDTAIFTDLSQAFGGVIVEWQWDFGNSNTSILQNPTNVFATSGTFDVSLQVTDDLGCTQDTTIEVSVSILPFVTFQYDSVCLGFATNFNSSNSNGGSGNIINYSWDFGDGIGVSSDENPTYTYLSAGTFNVCLTIESDLNCPVNSVTYCENIIVYDLPAVIASANDTICLGNDLQLSASGGSSYLWSPDYFISDINISAPTVSPQVDTTYLVTVTDLNGCISSDSVKIQVTSLTSNFSFNDVCVGDTANFTDLSQATSGTIVNWSWDFGDGQTSNLQNVTYVYSTSGIFDVSLVVTDGIGCSDSSSQTVNISVPPFADFIADSVCRGVSTNFNSSNSNGGSGNIIGYSWDFGVVGATSSIANPTFTYTSAGTYTVCLTVTSDINCTGNESTYCSEVIVYELPVADFSVDTSCFGNANNFINNSQSGTGSITDFLWDFGQNTADTLLQNSLSNTQFEYSLTGNYNTSLTVTDEFGCSSIATATARVYENPTASFSFTSACIGQANEFVSTSSAGADNPLNQYVWNFDEGAGFVTGDSIQQYAFNNSGIHFINHVVIDAFGCSDTSVQQLDIIAAPNAIIVASDSIVCSGNSINFNASSSVVQVAPASYEWDFNFNTGVDQTNANPVYIPNNSSIVALFVQDGNGCRDTSFLNVTVLEIPEADFTFTPACEDIAINLNSTSTPANSPILNYEWTVDGVTQLNGQNIQYTHSTGNDTIEILLLITDTNGCEDGVIYNIYVEEQPIIENFVSEFTICAGESITLNLNDTTQFSYSGIGSFEWTPLNGIDNPLSDSVVITPNQTTIYNVIGYGANNVCPLDDDNQITIRVLNKPTITIDATPNPIILGTSSEITVDVIPYNAASDSIIWTNGQNSLFPLLGGNVTASPQEETTYPLTFVYSIDTFRCSLDTFITITVLDVCSEDIVYIPNIFTPNNDGKNDEFRISGYGLTVINKFIVFDRWGKIMYEGNNLPMVNGKMQNGWRGTNKNGQACNSGVYVYLYEATCANGSTVKGNGNVTLIK